MQKTGQFGSIIKSSYVEEISFFSEVNLLDYNTLFICVSYLNSTLANGVALAVQTNDPNSLKKVDAQISKRKGDFKEFLENGGLILCFLTGDPADSELEKSSLLDKVTEGHLNLLNLFGIKPKKFKLEKIVGNVFENFGPFEKLAPFLNFRYLYYLKTFEGAPVFKTGVGNKVLGVQIRVKKGWVYLLPSYSVGDQVGHAAWTNVFSPTIINLISQIPPVEDVEKPEWVFDYPVYDEEIFLKEKMVLEQERLALETKISVNSEKLKKYEALKGLLYGGDLFLENTVKEFLIEIGFNVIAPPDNQVDLQILEDDFKAVIEVKGVLKSGAMSYSMQLEKWSSDFAIANDEFEPIAILIINPFKNLSPPERTEQVFPKNMIEYSVKRNHCLMLTMDLLNLLIDFRENLIDKNQIKDLLKSTCGVLEYQSQYKI